MSCQKVSSSHRIASQPLLSGVDKEKKMKRNRTWGGKTAHYPRPVSIVQQFPCESSTQKDACKGTDDCQIDCTFGGWNFEDTLVDFRKDVRHPWRARIHFSGAIQTSVKTDPASRHSVTAGFKPSPLRTAALRVSSFIAEATSKSTESGYMALFDAM